MSIKNQAQRLKEVIVAEKLATKFDYVPNFEEKKDKESFKEFINEYGEDLVRSACEIEGMRDGEVTDMITYLGLDLIKKIEEDSSLT